MNGGNLTEFEESLSFDIDDPDFPPTIVRKASAKTVLHKINFRDRDFGVNKGNNKKKLLSLQNFSYPQVS